MAKDPQREQLEKQLGQTFTPQHVAEFMVTLSQAPRDAKVLEPGCGEGVFFRALRDAGYKYLVGYEIDTSLEVKAEAKVVSESFVSAEIKDRFGLVIGNPPYVRWRNLTKQQQDELNASPLWRCYCNSLCDLLNFFILRGVELLVEGGEMIFVTPEYWMNTKHAQRMRDYLAEHGYFSDIIHFSETPIFQGVASSIAIWRYVKTAQAEETPRPIRIIKYHSKKKLTAQDLARIASSTPSPDIEVFERRQFSRGQRWLLAPSEVEAELLAYESSCKARPEDATYATLGDIADIGNGLVSGLDRAFQLPSTIQLSKEEHEATISVVKAKNMQRFVHGELTRYIFVEARVKTDEELLRLYPAFHAHLQPYREMLAKRYAYARDLPYWEWAFLRSFKLFSRDQGRIFVPCKERVSHKDYVRFAYVEPDVFPTQDVTALLLKPGVKEHLLYVLAILNSRFVFDWARYNGVMKGNIVEFSERPLASIPVKRIDWDNPREVAAHDAIVAACRHYLAAREPVRLAAIAGQVSDLLGKTPTQA